MTSTEPKILRIGIIQGGKVIEERLVRKRTTVSVGTEDGNVFVLSGPNLPRTWPLFEMRGDAYHLVFDEAMDGRVSIETDGMKGAQETNIDFAGLKAQGRAEKHGERWRIPLDDTSRGRVQIAADLTVLFHFVVPPPLAPKPELPPTVRRGILKQVEPIFTLVLAASFLVHTAVALMVRYVEPPPPPTAEDLRVLIQKITPPKVDVPPIAPTKPDATIVGTGAAQASAGEGEGGGAGTGRKGKGGGAGKGTGAGSGGIGPSRADVRAAIAGKGLLAVIGVASGDGGGGAIANVFGSGSAIDSDVGAALQGTAGVAIATGGDGVTRRGGGGGGVAGDGTGGGGGGAASIGDLGGGGGGKVETGTKEAVRVAATVQTDDLESVDGKIDKKSVAQAIRRRQDAFQQCYEAALKAESKLAGKLVVEFTIDEQGKVSAANVVKDQLGSGEVAKCVVATLKRIRFPAPADGEVTIANTFVFQPGGSG